MKNTFLTPFRTFALFFFAVLLLFPISRLKAQYSIKSTKGDLNACDTLTKNIFVIWWDKSKGYSKVDFSRLLDSIVSYRNDCIQYGMQDPPNPGKGFFYNVYMWGPGDFFAANGIGGMGQGTDENSLPYLVLPISGLNNDWIGFAHETFHIFQYSAQDVTPGFSYSGASQWFIEASANWFASVRYRHLTRAFVSSESLVKQPQVPLWLSFDNFPEYYPDNWNRKVHQYAMGGFLYYLTEVKGYPRDLMSGSFYSGTSENPQEYFFNRLGGPGFRNEFMEFAGNITGGFNYLRPDQIAENRIEFNNVGDKDDVNEYIQTYDNSGSGGAFRPSNTVTTTGWSFNTYKINNYSSASYTFQLKGDKTGTSIVTGSPKNASYFQGLIVVLNNNTGTAYYDLKMKNDQEGSFTLNAKSDDNTIYFVIASMPEEFRDIDVIYSYEINIEK